MAGGALSGSAFLMAIYEWIVTQRQEGNYSMRYGRSGAVYRYASHYNHNHVTLKAEGLTWAEVEARRASCQAPLGTDTYVDALGNTYTGLVVNFDSSRPKRGLIYHWCSAEMLDPAIS